MSKHRNAAHAQRNRTRKEKPPDKTKPLEQKIWVQARGYDGAGFEIVEYCENLNR